MTELVCHKCGHAWNYKGKSRRISCSHCKTTITIGNGKSKETVEEISKQIPAGMPVVTSEPAVTTMTLSVKLAQSQTFLKALSWAKANGEDTIKLIPNSQGELNLPV